MKSFLLRPSIIYPRLPDGDGRNEAVEGNQKRSVGSPGVCQLTTDVSFK